MTRTRPARALVDDPAREAIRSSLGETLFVEAAAGTGKTTSLVERMVALVCDGVSVEEIAAVTFTIKAAAELDERFQAALERALRGEKSPARRERLERALGQLDSCFVGTIHAFCAMLLRERPVEAGLEPGFRELDEADDRSERAASWRRFGERLFLDENPTLERLVGLGVKWNDLEPTFDDLCENEDVLPVAEPEGPPPDLTAVRAQIEAYLDATVPELPESVPAAGWDKLQSALRQADRLRRILGPSAADTADILAALATGRSITQNRWRNAAKAVALFAEHEQFVEEVVNPALTRWREFLHPIALSLLTPAVRSYREWRRGNGRASFQDLLVTVRDLLRDHPEVRRDLQSRFRRVLVDEFQDTDPIQAEVVLYLTGGDVNERDCWRLAPIPGSLFVVGDPKQSIYRFRRADIETYGRMREAIRSNGGRVLQLTTNFRSTGIVCDWVNEAFERLLPSEADASPEQAPYARLSAFEPLGGAEAGAFRLEPRGAASNNKIDLVEADSARVGAAVASALAGRGLVSGEAASYRPGDFLILLRRRANMKHYARALEERGIPFEISGGDAFKSEDDLATLVMALRAVADPDDPVPLVATLRGPLFGVDDRALFLFKTAGGRFQFTRRTPAGTDLRIEDAFAALREGQAMSEMLPPGAAVARFAERLGWIAAKAAGEIGDTRAGNLLKALASARERSRAGDSFARVVRHLADLAAEGEAEEMTTTPGQPDAVRLMTVHAAKGLEARVVFLADPTDTEPQGPRFSVDRDGREARGHFLVWKSSGEHGRIAIAQPKDWAAREAREEAFDAAERTRLLYVASTRARETVIVSVRRGVRNQGWKGPWGPLGPMLPRELPEAAAVAGVEKRILDAATLERERETARRERRERRVASEIPSYRTATVTGLTHAPALGDAPGGEGAERPFVPGTGRGMSWGSALHRLLEASMRHPDLDLRTFAVNVLAEEDRPAHDLDAALAAVEGVRRSALWTRALAAKQCLVEVPFSLAEPQADGDPKMLVSGAIDLVFEEEDGWTLVDYKSDTIADNFDALVAFYRPQIARYRDVWRALTGRPTRAGLFFLHDGRTDWLPG